MTAVLCAAGASAFLSVGGRAGGRAGPKPSALDDMEFACVVEQTGRLFLFCAPDISTSQVQPPVGLGRDCHAHAARPKFTATCRHAVAPCRHAQQQRSPARSKSFPLRDQKLTEIFNHLVIRSCCKSHEIKQCKIHGSHHFHCLYLDCTSAPAHVSARGCSGTAAPISTSGSL